MKKIIIILLFANTAVFAQVKYGVTTMDQYTYLDKMYPIEQKQNVKLRDGYSVLKNYYWKERINWAKWQVIANDKNEIIGFGCWMRAGKNIREYWHFIPVGDAELIDKATTELSDISNGSMLRTFFKSFSHLLLVELKDDINK